MRFSAKTAVQVVTPSNRASIAHIANIYYKDACNIYMWCVRATNRVNKATIQLFATWQNTSVCFDA